MLYITTRTTGSTHFLCDKDTRYTDIKMNYADNIIVTMYTLLGDSCLRVSLIYIFISIPGFVIVATCAIIGL